MHVTSSSSGDLGAAALKVAQSLQPRQSGRNLTDVVGSAKTIEARALIGGATTGGAAITSSDFLKLLVTEMKNQDPTQPTDPNAYIQQLVGVNSLQQLIAINQDLSNQPTSVAAPGRNIATTSV